MTGQPLPATVDHALAQARSAGVDRLDAQLLLARALDRPRTWLLAHGEAPLSAGSAARFATDLARRATGEPLAYLLGTKEFHGLALQVDARVLVPRPDTEVLVDWAIELLRADSGAPAAPAVVDLGTGSGAIALAVKQACPNARVVATDASRAALEVAAANAARLGLPVDFRQGRWWDAVAGEAFDLVLANPPYIASGDPHLGALGHEPVDALVAGIDGLAALRQIVADAAAGLRRGGWLLLEHGFEQATAVQDLLRAQGFAAAQTRLDLGGRPRCTGARLPA